MHHALPSSRSPFFFYSLPYYALTVARVCVPSSGVGRARVRGCVRAIDAAQASGRVNDAGIRTFAYDASRNRLLLRRRRNDPRPSLQFFSLLIHKRTLAFFLFPPLRKGSYITSFRSLFSAQQPRKAAQRRANKMSARI